MKSVTIFGYVALATLRILGHCLKLFVSSVPAMKKGMKKETRQTKGRNLAADLVNFSWMEVGEDSKETCKERNHVLMEMMRLCLLHFIQNPLIDDAKMRANVQKAATKAFVTGLHLFYPDHVGQVALLSQLMESPRAPSASRSRKGGTGSWPPSELQKWTALQNFLLKPLLLRLSKDDLVSAMFPSSNTKETGSRKNAVGSSICYLCSDEFKGKPIENLFSPSTRLSSSFLLPPPGQGPHRRSRYANFARDEKEYPSRIP